MSREAAKHLLSADVFLHLGQAIHDILKTVSSRFQETENASMLNLPLRGWHQSKLNMTT
jgi:hypothetical protein